MAFDNFTPPKSEFHQEHYTIIFNQLQAHKEQSKKSSTLGILLMNCKKKRMGNYPNTYVQ